MSVNLIKCIKCQNAVKATEGSCRRLHTARSSSRGRLRLIKCKIVNQSNKNADFECRPCKNKTNHYEENLLMGGNISKFYVQQLKPFEQI